MNFDLPRDIADLQDRIARFIAEEVDPLTVGIDADTPAPDIRREIARRANAAGIYRLALASSEGGQNAGPRTLTGAREALALSGNPLASAALSSGPGIMRLADNERQRRELYEPVLSGQRTAAFAFTEARTNSQPTQAIPTTLADGGDGYLVTGGKAFVTGGASADWLVVVANVPADAEGGGGTALLVVDRDAPGVSQGELGQSIDGSTHSPFHFDDTPVPASRLLGNIGDGLPRAMANIDQMRLGVAADAVGWSRWVNRQTLARIEAPHRSGQPLAEQQQVQAIFADMVTDAHSARAALYRAAEARECDEPTAGTQVAAAKWLSTEVLHRTVDRAIQLHGAQALLHGHPLERLYRWSRSLRIAEGPTELLRLTVTRHIRQNGPNAL